MRAVAWNWLAHTPLKKNCAVNGFWGSQNISKKRLACRRNVAARPDKVKIISCQFFDGKDLIMKCDPVISPMNYKFMGKYYLELTKWIMSGKKIMKFPGLHEFMFGKEASQKLMEGNQ